MQLPGNPSISNEVMFTKTGNQHLQGGARTANDITHVRSEFVSGW